MEHHLLIDYDKEKRKSFKSDDHRYNVYVKLCCRPCFEDRIIRPHSPEPLIQSTYQPLIQTVVLLNVYDEEEGRKSMKRMLRDWPLQPEARRWLIKQAMKDARELFASIPPHHDTMLLLIRVRANHVCVYYEQEEDVWMVPADESSIESLKKKIIDCSICLDEILIGAEALPCCHVFHEYCIKKWLKKKRSCPICRERV